MLSRKLIRAKEIEKFYKDGDLIVREGDATRNMFVIQSGQVAISKRMGGREVPLATLGKGDFFGEMSLLESLPRDANARAIGETRLLVISAGGLLVRIRRDPTFAFEMLHRLSARIRLLNGRLIRVLERSGSSEEAEVLLFSTEADGARKNGAAGFGGEDLDAEDDAP
jgi:CRP-like cAMP-binding protein